ncbi:electron transfer flavoprotein-ubiquinone oxidoreductase [Marinobacter nanhaiticus D15-8W]|uniref:Electron transfer flavoprotein-ubiquinone oxidoreductase n=1 Tax=Marinobacter nanhaiticus D15-8W TaxID=626887 RepID=N6WS94_9GAMM|nr:electron transfer flavoprotein-ubiquinone oxidoreductase [Marinobacter nanhaiticus]ENO13902.1 electron transfer flavoprotein-ubiquinone oxidoreductase [Marinobacter nanhaiticus D15-8W]BES71279.1 electron transfer flavoprotein-ubiquinone oxidoreductase [Marinobacter nanhaiticus D15-8W]
MERESMEFDVLIVGAGPAGLSAACRIMQMAQESGEELTVCVVEKGSEVGAHIMAGTVFEPTALNELFPDWKEKGAPLNTPVTRDDIFVLRGQDSATKVPNAFVPRNMHNHGNYIISLGNLCRWLAEQAEGLGVEVYPGFAASESIVEDGQVKGIITGDMGVARDGSEKEGYMPGMELRAKYTLFTEGCRGHLGKRLINDFKLDEGKDPQHYGIGIKELWDIDPAKHEPGLVVHTTGWPLNESGTTGGSFLYHLENGQVYVGLISDLSYSNPHMSPFQEFQRLKLHPEIRKHLEGGKRVSYGARAITKGGFNSLPKMSFPGGLLLGCDAGTLNSSKIKGSHTAMKSGLLGAEAVFEALKEGKSGEEITSFQDRFKNSWLYKELYDERNFGPTMHKYGNIVGGGIAFFEQNILRRSLPMTFHDTTPDYATLKSADQAKKIDYPKPDNTLTFDRLSSVFISNTNHEEDQPVHLKLTDPNIPIEHNLPKYDEPAQRYCPAGVYEVVEKDDGSGKRFQINAQNCVHCKTCDIKDPAQNITWVTPEGGGGPNYPNM